MKRLLQIAAASAVGHLLGFLFYCVLALLLGGCQASRPLTASAVDSVLRVTISNRGKVKVKGNLTVQAGPGNVATTTDNTKAGQRGGAAATGDGSAATATTKKGGSPFWLVLVVGLSCFAGGVYVGVNFAPRLGWLRRGVKLAALASLLWLATSCAGTRYSYKEARAAERWHHHMVRHYRRQNNREFRDHRHQHQQQRRLLRQWRPVANL